MGSLGLYPHEAPVIGIRVKNCTLTDTTNGVRVKTWPDSPQGSATGMHFENLIMNNVANPIYIDQEYCPYFQCKLQVSGKGMEDDSHLLIPFFFFFFFFWGKLRACLVILF